MGLASVVRFVVRHPLSRGRRLRNLARFVIWQAWSRLIGLPVAFRYGTSSKMFVAKGQTAASGHFYVGLHEFEDMAFVAHALRPGDVFADVGANVGAYALLAAERGSRVVAFEPVPETRAWLVRNVALNGHGDRIEVRGEAVAEAPGEIAFTTTLGASNRAAMSGADEAAVVTVPRTTLDLALSGRWPTVIKVDVEGYETLVVAGATETLARPELAAVVMEFNGSGKAFGFEDAALLADLRGRGFSTYAYLPFERRLVPAVEARSPTSDNLILVRDLARVARLVAESPALEVRGFRL